MVMDRFCLVLFVLFTSILSLVVFISAHPNVIVSWYQSENEISTYYEKKMYLMNISLQCIDNTEQQYYSLRHRWIKFTLTESGVICIILIVSHIIPQKIMIHDRSALLHCSYCGEYQHLVDHLPNLCNSRMSHHLSKPCNIYWLH